MKKPEKIQNKSLHFSKKCVIIRKTFENTAKKEIRMTKLTDKEKRVYEYIADTINSVEVNSGEFDNINNLSNAFRADEVKESLPVEEILKNAPEQAEDHFLVRKRA